MCVPRGGAAARGGGAAARRRTLVQNEIISFINDLYAYSSLIGLDLDLVVRFLARNLILEAFFKCHRNV